MSGAGLHKGLTQYGDTEFSLFLRKAFIKGAGYSDDALDRPIVGITNTGSGFNPCHGNVPDLIEAVKRGVYLNGGLPIEFPTISIHESFSHPTSMYMRNLMSMDTEEMLRALPIDSVVLIGGCDKTVPAQLMGAASVGLPAVQLVTGPMLTGSFQGQRVGACTDCRGYWGKYRAAEISGEDIAEVNDQLVSSVGTCCVMGTASTMASLAEALGIILPGSATAPAVTAERMRLAERTGEVAVNLIQQKLSINQILTKEAFVNALRVLFAIGGSTNGLVHLAAVAGRLGMEIDLSKINQISAETPVLVNLKPSGSHYMEDFHKAGGVQAVLHELKPQLNLEVMTVTGQTLGQLLEQARPTYTPEVIKTRSQPIYEQGGIAVLWGNLAPQGAIIKQSSASAQLMEHEGRAVVFEDAEDMAQRLDDPNLEVHAEDVLVLKKVGPKGGIGMPEAGYIPIPKKLAQQGVTDMVRISDGRMSGTASGTIVLHITPEAAVGGPLAAVQTGDRIRLSVKDKKIELLVSEEEIQQRLEATAEERKLPQGLRGYKKLFLESVLQANEGVDFDFLQATEITRSIP